MKKLAIAVTGLVIVLISLGISACSRSKAKELVPFEAPMFHDQREEVRYLWAQTQRYMISTHRDHDVNFDSWVHVQSHFQELVSDLGSIDYQPDLLFEERELLLSRTPEILRFQGARENAVALGILAWSIWRRDPERKQVSIAELNACANTRDGKPCQVEPRLRALQRMMIMGEFADEDLFDRLRRQMPPVRRLTHRYLQDTRPVDAGVPEHDEEEPDHEQP